MAWPAAGESTSDRGGAAIGAKDRPGNLAGASDQQVVEWAKDGQEPAFRELVRRYERPVFSLIYRMVRDRALAEDLAQETFMALYRQPPRLDGSGGLGGWLLVTHQGLVPLPANFGDCIHPANGHCFKMGHPYAWEGVLVWLIAGIGSVVSWRVGSNLAAGRSLAGYPKGTAPPE